MVEHLVAEDDIWWHMLLFGTLESQGTEGVEEFGILHTGSGRQPGNRDGGNLKVEASLGLGLFLCGVVDDAKFCCLAPIEDVLATG